MTADADLPYPGDEPQPPSDEAIIAGLLAPQHGEPINWRRDTPAAGELDCRQGLHNVQDHPFTTSPDAANAIADFAQFCRCAAIPRDGGCPIHLMSGDFRAGESFRIEIRPDGCNVLLASPAAVRRALVWLEDEMLRRGGPFLPLGSTEWEPSLRTRMILEYRALQADAPDGLPDTYLNRIAHCGVNAVILPLTWGVGAPVQSLLDPLPSAFIEALRTRIERYARYGIRLFIYAIEPHTPPKDGERSFYCTSRPEGRAALEHAMYTLFREAPGLGGLVLICVGERPSHCFSKAPPNNILKNPCPRCGERDANEVLAEMLATIERGIHAAAPDAEFIAWPYTQSAIWGEQATIDFAPHTPQNVCLMHNFEQGGRVEQLGRWYRTDDYWLAYAGPSQLFTACAEGVIATGRDLFAKIAVTCGHEIASVPYIPVPGLLYRKFRGVRAAGCSGAFMNWDSGNAPSLMMRAAGALAGEPFPDNEEAFLLALARRDWGDDAGQVVQAWQHFADAYEHFPATIGFSYFGPLHNGAAWPLYLEPADLVLPRNWMPDRWSGDRIGECLGYHSIEDAIELCRRMHHTWRRGTAILSRLRERYADAPARALDLAIALALEIHLESGLAILRFYDLREKLAPARGPQARELLEQMRDLVVAEKDASSRLAALCDDFPELGYCPEAGEYKYSAAKLRWRIGTLDRLLTEAFPRVEARLAADLPPFEPHADIAPSGPVLVARRLDGNPADPDSWRDAADTGNFALHAAHATRCAAAWDDEALYLRFVCGEPDMEALRADAADKSALLYDDHVWVTTEADAFHDALKFKVNPNGAREFLPFRPMGVRPFSRDWSMPRWLQPDSSYTWTATATRGRDQWAACLRLPWSFLATYGIGGEAIRLNLGRRAGPTGAVEQFVWAPSIPPRDGRSSPAPYGRLVLED